MCFQTWRQWGSSLGETSMFRFSICVFTRPIYTLNYGTTFFTTHSSFSWRIKEDEFEIRWTLLIRNSEMEFCNWFVWDRMFLSPDCLNMNGHWFSLRCNLVVETLLEVCGPRFFGTQPDPTLVNVFKIRLNFDTAGLGWCILGCPYTSERYFSGKNS